MRFSKVSMALSATVLLVGALAPLAAQEPVKVDVSIPASHTVWYADPFWLGIGAVAVLIILVLAVMASRKGDSKSTTTVIR
jgi:formate-dependent nitrite reductase membrane component NrfD